MWWLQQWLLSRLHGAALLFPQEARLEGLLFFFEFMFLIGSNYKGPQRGPGREGGDLKRTWERQAPCQHPPLPPATYTPTGASGKRSQTL